MFEANNAEQIGTCFKDFLETMERQSVTDTVQVKVLDSENGHRMEGAEVVINGIPIGLTNKAGVVAFEATNCTTLDFQVQNLDLFEPFQIETQLVLPTLLQLNIKPKKRKIQVQITSEKDRIPMGNATVRIQGEGYESGIDGFVKPSKTYRVGTQIRIEAMRSGFAPELVKYEVTENNGKDNEVSITLKPFTGICYNSHRGNNPLFIPKFTFRKSHFSRNSLFDRQCQQRS